MRKFILGLLLLLSFFLASCSDKEAEKLEASYDAMDYGGTVKAAERMLEDDLDPDALFYKAMASYKMADDDEAFNAAVLYALLYKDNESHFRDMMRLILHTSDHDGITINAGKVLWEDDVMTKQDLSSFYTALARVGEEHLAEEVYVKVTPLMTAGEIAMMNVLAEAPSLRILSSLERLYQTSGLSRDFIEVAMMSIPLFINRGEGELLYETVKRGYGKNLGYALYIGDLMYSLGKNDEAAIYWNAAREAYPDEAGARLAELGYTELIPAK